jgi:hypothetical protein
MLQRFAFGSPSNLVSQRLQQMLRDFAIKLQVQFETLLGKSIRQQVLNVQSRVLDLPLGKISRGALQEFENGH